MYIKTLVMVMGPTASGKTSLSIALAKYFGTVILSADSRQLYKEMIIGTAKPSEAELAQVPHYFIGNISINDTYTAGRYEHDALHLLQKLFAEKDIVIACGGSNLYIKALLEGIDEMPHVSADVKKQVEAIFLEEGLKGLQKRLNALDPAFLRNTDIQNHRRLSRALEVSIASGKPYSSFLTNTAIKRDFNIIKIGLDVPREELYRNINARCDQMLDAGLLDEVKELYPYRNFVSLQTVGYQEFFEYMDGKYSLDEAIIKFKQHTRNYAKRQMTWFRKEKDIFWFKPADTDKIIEFISERSKADKAEN